MEDIKHNTVTVISERCKGCWNCIDACPIGVFELDYVKKHFVAAVVDDKFCTTPCSVCEKGCKQNAITVTF